MSASCPRYPQKRTLELSCVSPGFLPFDGPGRSEAVRLKIKHLLTIPSPNRGRLGREPASKAKQQMLGKSDLVETSQPRSRSRSNIREAPASDVITLTAEIAVLEASL